MVLLQFSLYSHSFLSFGVWSRESILLFLYYSCAVDGWCSFFATSHELLLLSTAVDITQEKGKIHFLTYNFAFPQVLICYLVKTFLLLKWLSVLHFVWHRIPYILDLSE